jgi:hypothetical protein
MMRNLWVAATMVALGSLTGCKVVTTTPPPPPPPVDAATYEACTTSDDCAAAADGCETISTDSSTRSMCSRTCTADTGCPGGGRCIDFGATGRAICFDACVGSATCEAGWSCQNAAAGVDVCLPGTGVPGPTSATYEICSTSADCISSIDECETIATTTATSAMCTSTCGSDVDCPGAGRCIDFGATGTAFCFSACSSSATCETGWTCQTPASGVNVCLPGTAGPPPGIPPYDECTFGSDDCSVESAGCFNVMVEGVTAGLCTSQCSSDASCPLDVMGERGRCISFDGGGIFTCWEACRDSGDCPTAWACKTSAGGVTFPAMCVPM